MMKRFLVLSVFLASLCANAQTHTVVQGDTAYNISKKYGMSLDDLFRMNPNIENGQIKIGDTLSISTKHTATTQKSSSATGYIILKPKQTIYGITKQYYISEKELRSLNPDLDNHMKIGDKVYLPQNLIAKYGESTATIANVEPKAIEVESQATSQISQGEDTYTVQPKDNYYRITKKFSMTQNQLFQLNPGLEEKGLKAGDVIKIKSTKATETIAKTETVTKTNANSTISKSTTYGDDEYVTYIVANGDTVFGIVNKFQVTLDELLALNPELSSGLKTGMVLKIKKYDAQYVKKSGESLNVVLMLPFGFDTNDSKYRSLSADFLAGAKLAIERNAKQGLPLDVKIIDAGNEESFKNSLIQINKDNTDLIIGPLFKSSVVEVLDYVGDTKIPIVAPFANSDDLYEHSNLIIVKPDDAVYATRIAEETIKVFEGQKIYIVADDDQVYAKQIAEQLKKNTKNPKIVIVKSPADINLENNMMTGQKASIIAILASKDENIGNQFANKMIQIGKEAKGNKAFSMYYNGLFEKKVDELSQVSLVYLMERKINTEGSFEKQILADYQAKYCKAPSTYAVIGFDVVNDILSRENKKGEIYKQIGKVQTQLATKFEYTRVRKNGAYLNTGYRVVRLVP